ncbi:MarR family transcriptional regulator [Lentzea fradiae]|uniref:MarR family transcriptional regulator n=1 Tax=Lentzea fradiae TaxID=200378 RepID=UPI00115FF624|nr:MarR family transcriptional regulator [Lentzea fradiae]
MTGREAANASGTFHFSGNPGGEIHLRDGGVVCAQSAGSPGPDALLLRTGRISESEWAAALATGTRGGIGATELHVVAMMAAHDAAFTIAAGDVDDCAFIPEAPGVAFAMSVPIDPVQLLRETSRRITSLLAMEHPLRPHRDRLTSTRGSRLRVLSPLRAEILSHATGGPTARDIAFASGRGVYPVTVEASRMAADGLLTVVTDTSPPSPELGVDIPLPRSLRSRPRLDPDEEKP